MGAGHPIGQHRPQTGPRTGPQTTALHRLPPECSLAAVVLFVLLVVMTPRAQVGAFVAYAAVLALVAAVGHVPPLFVLRRLVVEMPFLTFAVLLPFVTRGERVDVLGLSLSEPGLWAAFNVLAKATLGAAAMVLLLATTPVRDLLTGLERLGLPRGFVAIAAFMLRYSDVVVGELHRMRIARAARGYDPRTLLQARALAASAGALFVRAYERGERVHLAMLSRGYAGALPDLGGTRATQQQWATALLLPAAAAVVCAAAWWHT